MAALTGAIVGAVDMLTHFNAIDYSLMARIVTIGRLGADLPAPFNPTRNRVTLDARWVEEREFTIERLLDNVRAPRHSDPDRSNSAHCSAA